MTPAPGVTFSDIHSTAVVETGDQVSVWLTLSDGSLVAVYLSIAQLIAAGHCIEEAPHTLQ